MYSKLRVFPCEVGLAGEAALGFLSSSRGGKVLAAVTRAVYLLSDQDELFWITTEPSSLHRRCLQVKSPLPHMAAGARYQAGDNLLLTDSGVGIDFGSALVWKTKGMSQKIIAPVTRVIELLNAVYRQISDWPKPAGLDNLIPILLQAARVPSPHGEAGLETLFSGTFNSAVNGIVHAFHIRNFDLVLENASRLVGLGDGLTPFGDDFLGGLLCSLEFLRRANIGIMDLLSWNFTDFILQCKSLTNLISFTLLKDHAEGHTLEPLYGFAHALLSGQPDGQCLPFARQLVAVGHSTGWYILSGFLTGMSAVFPQ